MKENEIKQKRTPVDAMLDREANFKPVEPPEQPGELPYVTHEGFLKLGDKGLRCYILNTGQRIFNADDVQAFFGDDLSEMISPST